MAKKVTAIPATISKFTAAPINTIKKRRVAGYARVSTDHEDQASSYAAQVDYYTSYIKGRDDWEYVDIYTDEGISATNTKKREGFNRMIKDALAGKIDLIITKSVSRFARNTVDSLTTIRKLKEKGIEVYFEKENIWTLDAKGELLLTIMSSLAQEEARNISENTTWGKRKMFSDGRYHMNYSRFLGYDKGPDGGIVVNEEQAKVVRFIYKSYLSGLSTVAIAKKLMEKGIKAPGGGDKWHWNTVRSILSNEKYKGDALLQKKYTSDYLTKKLKVNNGEVPQYYIEDDHEAIISPEVFDRVQIEIVRRSKSENKFSGVSIFSSKVRCGDCGNWYGPKVWHSNDKYRKVVFRCNHKYQDGHKCTTPHYSEDELKQMSVKAINLLLEEKDEIIENIENCLAEFCKTDELKKRQENIVSELTLQVEIVQELVAENARRVQNQEVYQAKYDKEVSVYERLKAKYDSIEEEIQKINARQALFDSFIKEIKSLEGPIEDFDEGVFGILVEEIIVKSKETTIFKFMDGTEVTI